MKNANSYYNEISINNPQNEKTLINTKLWWRCSRLLIGGERSQHLGIHFRIYRVELLIHILHSPVIPFLIYRDILHTNTGQPYKEGHGHTLWKFWIANTQMTIVKWVNTMWYSHALCFIYNKWTTAGYNKNDSHEHTVE